MSVLIMIWKETFCTSEQRYWSATLRVPERWTKNSRGLVQAVRTDLGKRQSLPGRAVDTAPGRAILWSYTIVPVFAYSDDAKSGMGSSAALRQNANPPPVRAIRFPDRFRGSGAPCRLPAPQGRSVRRGRTSEHFPIYKKKVRVMNPKAIDYEVLMLKEVSNLLRIHPA